MKRISGANNSKRLLSCPQCRKRRMTRELDHEVSKEQQEYTTRANATVLLHTDICDWCKASNWRRYFEPSRADIRRVMKSLQENVELDENESLEELL